MSWLAAPPGGRPMAGPAGRIATGGVGLGPDSADEPGNLPDREFLAPSGNASAAARDGGSGASGAGTTAGGTAG
jgi:hypothetical protein